MLQAKNITIKYGAKTVLENVSLDFAEGSLTAIIGRNGCGKSTPQGGWMHVHNIVSCRGEAGK